MCFLQSICSNSFFIYQGITVPQTLTCAALLIFIKFDEPQAYVVEYICYSKIQEKSNLKY
jgi:hypothetical protein